MRSIGHGEKITRKQETAIAALLTCDTVTEAARDCGVSEATLYRWLNEAEFADRYAGARQAILWSAICDVQAAAREAVETMRRLMRCGTPAVELRAATSVLDTALRTLTVQELEDRVAHLEDRLQAEHGGRA